MPQEPPRCAFQQQHQPNPGLSGATCLPPVFSSWLQVELFYSQETLNFPLGNITTSSSRPPKKAVHYLLHTTGISPTTDHSGPAKKSTHTRLHTKITDTFEQASGNLSDLSDFASSPLSLPSVFGGDVHIFWWDSFAFRRRPCFDHTHCFSAFCFCFGGFVSIISFSAFYFVLIFVLSATTRHGNTLHAGLLALISLLGEFLAGWLR